MKKLIVHLDYIKQTHSPTINVNFTNVNNKPLQEKITIDFNELKKFTINFYEFINNIYSNINYINNRKSYAGLKSRGTVLYKMLFKKELSSQNFDSIIFSMDKELIFIPFELIYDNNFWCLKYKISRQIKFRSAPTFTQNIGDLEGAIISNPMEDKILEPILTKERETIYKTLRKIKRVKLTPPYAGRLVDKKFFLNVLLENNLIYFSGHSYSENKSKSYIPLYKSKIRYSDLKNLNLSYIELFFSNSCQSSLVKKTNNFKSSLLYAFIQTGIQNYIGSVFNLKLESAALFAETFFKYLSEGKNIGESILNARRTVFKKYKFKDASWFSFTFYGNSEYKIISKKNFKNYSLITILLLLLGITTFKITPVKVIHKKNRLNTLIIFPFSYYDRNLKEKANEITYKFYKKFKNKYKLVEREKLKEILKEMKLSESRYIDKNNAIHIGKLLSAKYMIYGNIYKIKTKIIINYRLIDIETSEIKNVKQEIIKNYNK